MTQAPSQPRDCDRKREEVFAAVERERQKLLERQARSFGRARRGPRGVIEYPKKGWEPPPDIEGYKRDPGNAWRFIPIWPECKCRIQNFHIKQCGALGVLTVCNNPESEHYRDSLTLPICEGCPLKCVPVS